jgi:hypothetical protein
VAIKLMASNTLDSPNPEPPRLLVLAFAHLAVLLVKALPQGAEFNANLFRCALVAPRQALFGSEYMHFLISEPSSISWSAFTLYPKAAARNGKLRGKVERQVQGPTGHGQ